MLALWFLGTLAGDRFIRLATTTASFNMHGSNPIDRPDQPDLSDLALFGHDRETTHVR
jgi:hypothetical protein